MIWIIISLLFSISIFLFGVTIYLTTQRLRIFLFKRRILRLLENLQLNFIKLTQFLANIEKIKS